MQHGNEEVESNNVPTNHPLLPAQGGKRIWTWAAILTAIVWVYPVESQTTRLAMILGAGTVWAGALFLWWKRSAVRIALLATAGLLATGMCLPGRMVDPNALAADYGRCLRAYRGVRYVWGGEGWLGIDCSGLVRKGLVWAQLHHGLKTMNGKPIRNAIALWWHDRSAEAIRDGYRAETIEVLREDSIAKTDPGRLRTGDLAVTADGVHVMAYLGQNSWIEADPDEHKVVELTLPSNNPWFHSPVVLVRWAWLSP